ncbi:MAG: hypothetical protein NZ483_04685 [Verrucomicrobiae bacterium]|nr:hypothetical protein [Verrucomicrobiae bacterium]MDW8343608.1 hypothetical protein [Verrucomicrobiae bacterium]
MFRLTPREARLIVALSTALIAGYVAQEWRLRTLAQSPAVRGESVHDGKN